MKIQIEKMVYGGEGYGKMGGKGYFVPLVLPGEAVEIEITQEKTGYGRGVATQFYQTAPERIPPSCPYFGACGGCHWQYIDYPAQLRFKTEILAESLRRIAKITDLPIEKPIASCPSWHYRNRVQLKLTGNKFGYFKKGSHEGIDIDHCQILQTELSKIIPEIRAFFTTGRHIDPTPGEIQMFCSTAKEILVKAIYPRQQKSPKLFSKGAAELFLKLRQAVSANIVGYSTHRQTFIGGLDLIESAGTDSITELFHGLSYRIGLHSFFQVNPFQIPALLEAVLSEFSETAQAIVGDLYCGVGLFTLPLSKRVRKAFGIEANAKAIQDAKFSQKINQTPGIDFYPIPVEKALPIIRRHDPDGLVVDPPRNGLLKNFLLELSTLNRLHKIVYVSCNPSTLARDIFEMLKSGYSLKSVKLIDLFPQTFHIEAIAVLTR